MECYFFSLLIRFFFQKSEWILVKVLKQELDFKIGLKKIYTTQEYESDELCLYLTISRGSAVVISITTIIFLL